MLCEKCQQKPATVHMQQIVNGSKTEMHLCQDCSAHMEAPLTIETLLNGLLGSILAIPIEKAVAVANEYNPCPVCDMTYEDFKAGGGKLGCAECYTVFSRELESVLKNVQTSTRHEGKFPKQFGSAMFQAREAVRLRELMQKAIADENFEEAARLRDTVRALETAEEKV